LGTLIENFLNRLSTKTKIITIRQPELNGEIGAVDCARGHLSEEFLVLHGDNYLAELDYFISHKKIRTKEAKVLVGMDKNKTKDGVFYLTCSGTLSVVGNENTVPVTPLGCYLLNPSVFEEIDELKRSDVRTYSNYHLFRKLLEKGHRVYGVRKRGIVVNINTVQDLVYLRRELCNSGKSEISAHN
jgi:NDP-sugar pyrophosphorylase family protein